MLGVKTRKAYQIHIEMDKSSQTSFHAEIYPATVSMDERILLVEHSSSLLECASVCKQYLECLSFCYTGTDTCMLMNSIGKLPVTCESPLYNMEVLTSVPWTCESPLYNMEILTSVPWLLVSTCNIWSFFGGISNWF